MFTESQLHRKDVSGRVVIIYLKLNIYFVRKPLFFFLHARAHTQTKDQNSIIQNLLLKYLILEGPEPLYYVYLSVCLCLSVCLSVCLSHLRSARSAERTSNKKTSSLPRTSYVFNISDDKSSIVSIFSDNKCNEVCPQVFLIFCENKISEK